jgi:hypothetical protein
MTPPQTSRELVEDVIKCQRYRQHIGMEWDPDAAAALIDAYVAVRLELALQPIRAEVYDLRARGANSDPTINALYRGWAERVESALTAARKRESTDSER